MIAAFLVSTAFATSRTFCVDINTDYTDIAGDFWTSNDPRPARGVQYELAQNSVVIESGFLGSNGCVTTDIPSVGTTVTVYTRATVNGITLEARRIPAFWSLCHLNGSMDSASWTVPGYVTLSDQAVGPDDTWRNLALASWAMYRNTHGINVDVPRPCCLPGSTYQANGLCNTGVTNYDRQSGKVYLYTVWQAGNFGDDMPECPLGGGDPDYQGRALRITAGTAIRTLIAHEFGHLVTSMRMGGADLWTLNPSLDGCMGDYTNPAGSTAADWPGQQRRGEFSKEYMAAAIREGYADYYAAWLFNSRQHTDGVLDMWTFHDFDLDCVIDNASNGQVPLNGSWGVTGSGDGINWLDDMQSTVSDSRSANSSSYSCTNPNATLACATSSSATDHNRATMIDVARMFWNLNQVPSSVGADLLPREITDLYLGSCPRMWDDVQPGTNDADHPFNRLRSSAGVMGVVDEFDDFSDRIRP